MLDHDCTVLKNKEDLPILCHKWEIVEIVRKNRITIIIGDTGSGKTTQLPQIMMKSRLNNNKMIGVTQPRRIAAINMAKRVASEMRCQLGGLVGYEIRFDRKVSKATKIQFMTDGIFLNCCANDFRLEKYGVIIIDEVHERSINTDVILGLLKMIVEQRPDLKVIITSATMKCEQFSTYFNGAPIIKISGKMYPVEENYVPYTVNLIEAIYAIVKLIHDDGKSGDILVFLTGREDIEECCESLGKISKLVVFPLYGAIDYESQEKVFKPVQNDERKAIVATNIAETSITIANIRYVIDGGFVKQNQFNARVGVDILKKVRISKAQADQRKGRAGRTNTGWCYRLYSQEDYEQFDKETKPEIFRKSLSEIYLKLKALRINPINFDFIDPPKCETLLKCSAELQNLELLDKNDEITNLGKVVNSFPVEPQVGKVLCGSKDNTCCMDIITIFSMLCIKDVFNSSFKLRAKVKESKQDFYDPDGDHFVLLNVFNKWLEMNKSRSWCYKSCIKFEIMESVNEIRNQITQQLMFNKISVNFHSNRESVKKSILNGFYQNVCKFQSPGTYVNIHNNHKFFIFPGSSLINTSSEFIVYHGTIQIKRPFIHGLMSIDADMLDEFQNTNKPIGITRPIIQISNPTIYKGEQTIQWRPVVKTEYTSPTQNIPNDTAYFETRSRPVKHKTVKVTCDYSICVYLILSLVILFISYLLNSAVVFLTTPFST